MTLLATALTVAAVALVGSLLVALVVTVRADGYGTREPPPSHPRDDVVPGWPGRAG